MGNRLVLAVAGALLLAALTGCGSSSTVLPYTQAAPATTVVPTPTVVATTSAAPRTTSAAPTTVAVPSASEIRLMSLCEALTRGRAAMGFLVYPNNAAAACQAGTAGASSLLLCTAIYDATGALRASSDGRTTNPTVVAACPVPPSAAASASAAPASSAPAPAGFARRGTWWQQGTSGIANLWFFDPTDPARPSGVTREYRATGPGAQNAFAYTQSGASVSMAFSSGVQRTLTITAYDAARDILTVQLDGTTQQWYGCASGVIPVAAQGTC